MLMVLFERHRKGSSLCVLLKRDEPPIHPPTLALLTPAPSIGAVPSLRLFTKAYTRRPSSRLPERQITPEQAKAVVRVFEMYASGFGLARIAKTLLPLMCLHFTTGRSAGV
jgi:hypothetical protein